MLDLKLAKAKIKAKSSVRKRKEEEEAKRKEREALVQEIAETVLSRIERPKDGRDGRDGKDAPSLESIMREVRLALPEPKIVQETINRTYREEVPEARLRELIRQEIPEPRTPEIQVIEKEMDFDKDEFITKKDLDKVLRRIDQAIQNNRGGGSGAPLELKGVSVYVQDTQPTDKGPYLWIQTDADGNCTKFWVEDGNN